MINTIVCAGSTRDTCDIWTDVMMKLKREGLCELKYLFYWEDESKSLAKDILQGEDIYFHDHRLAWKGLGFPKNLPIEVIDSDDIKRFADKELIAIKMMDRIDPFLENFTFSMRQKFFRTLVCKWMSIITQMEIGLVIFPSIPHQIVDYALYYACCLKEIPYITFQHTPFLDASILTDSIDEFSPSFDFEYIQQGITNIDFQEYLARVRGVKAYKIDYMERQFRSNRQNILIPLITRLYRSARRKKNIKQLISWCFQTRWSYYVEKNIIPQDSKYSNFRQILYYFKKKRNLNRWRKRYEKYCAPQLPNKFLFFALHYQPEATTSPSAGHYVDQLLVIDMILNVIPPDVKLVVKEHPSQFLKISEGTQGRSDAFYDDLFSKGDRLHVAPVDADVNTIMLQSLGVITLTGTIGFEAIANNIPAIVFGRPWYEGAPNVYKVNNKKEVTAVIEKILHTENQEIQEDNLSFWLNKRSRSFVFSTPCGSYFRRSTRSKEEAIMNLSRAISEHVREKLKT